jgi:hypothetical protein
VQMFDQFLVASVSHVPVRALLTLYTYQVLPGSSNGPQQGVQNEDAFHWSENIGV